LPRTLVPGGDVSLYPHRVRPAKRNRRGRGWRAERRRGHRPAGPLRRDCRPHHRDGGERHGGGLRRWQLDQHGGRDRWLWQWPHRRREQRRRPLRQRRGEHRKSLRRGRRPGAQRAAWARLASLHQHRGPGNAMAFAPSACELWDRRRFRPQAEAGRAGSPSSKAPASRPSATQPSARSRPAPTKPQPWPGPP